MRRGILFGFLLAYLGRVLIEPRLAAWWRPYQRGTLPPSLISRSY